mgnify:CR=1 FL=1
MKRLILPIALLFLATAPVQLSAQAETDSTGLPGDNLDLYGVLELFKKANTMEEFEKSLNAESNQVNNLDLDADGNVDYIKVIDNTDSGAHAISLRVDIDDKESQDIAVIELDKTGTETADLQIVGDEELYGENYIIEPAEDEKGATEDKFNSKFNSRIIIVNVWGWPCVRHVYAPAYVVWVSPWRYHHYPPYFKPWRPVAWRVHHGRVVRYHHHCRRAQAHRIHRAHRVHHRHRVHSPGYHQRNAAHRGNGPRGGKQNGGGHKNNGGGNKGGGHRGGGRR